MNLNERLRINLEVDRIDLINDNNDRIPFNICRNRAFRLRIYAKGINKLLFEFIHFIGNKRDSQLAFYPSKKYFKEILSSGITFARSYLTLELIRKWGGRSSSADCQRPAPFSQRISFLVIDLGSPRTGIFPENKDDDASSDRPSKIDICGAEKAK